MTNSCTQSSNYIAWISEDIWCWGILVKLVICVLPGHWKTQILNFYKYISLVCFLCDHITPNEEKMLGHLIWPISLFLWFVLLNLMSREDKIKFTVLLWHKIILFLLCFDCICSLIRSQIVSSVFLTLF